jgi:hypothetical protein
MLDLAQSNKYDKMYKIMFVCISLVLQIIER